MTTDETTALGCPTCGTPVRLVRQGGADVWACPQGHGLGFTLDEAYGHVDEAALGTLWRASAAAPAGGRACPLCAGPLVTVAGEGTDVPVDVCRPDQLIWLDAGELEALPPDLPEPPLAPEEREHLHDIVTEYDRALAEAYAQGDLLDRVADAIARRHPGLAEFLEHALYGDRLDRMADETRRRIDDLLDGKAA